MQAYILTVLQGGMYGTALHAASHGGHAGIVKLLLESGADVNSLGESSYCPPRGIIENTLQAQEPLGAPRPYGSKIS